MWQARPRHPRAAGDGSLARDSGQSFHSRYTVPSRYTLVVIASTGRYSEAVTTSSATGCEARNHSRSSPKAALPLQVPLWRLHSCM